MKTNTPGSGNINGRTGSGDKERPLSTVGQNCRAKQQTAQLEREAGAHTGQPHPGWILCLQAKLWRAEWGLSGHRKFNQHELYILNMRKRRKSTHQRKHVELPFSRYTSVVWRGLSDLLTKASCTGFPGCLLQG